MEIVELRRIYRGTEQLILIGIALVLPVFGMIYLYYNSGNLDWDLPSLPPLVEEVLLVLGTGMLVGQYIFFHKRLKNTFLTEELILKLRVYANATKERYFLLFLVSLISSVGLLFFGNAGFVVMFAVALLFFSIAKPSPDRIAKLLKLDKDQKELIRQASRPD